MPTLKNKRKTRLNRKPRPFTKKYRSRQKRRILRKKRTRTPREYNK